VPKPKAAPAAKAAAPAAKGKSEGGGRESRDKKSSAAGATNSANASSASAAPKKDSGRDNGRESKGKKDSKDDAKKGSKKSGNRDSSPRPNSGAAAKPLVPTPVSETGQLPATAGWGMKKATAPAAAAPVAAAPAAASVPTPPASPKAVATAKATPPASPKAAAPSPKAAAPLSPTAAAPPSPAAAPAAAAAAAPAASVWGRSNAAVKEVTGLASTAAPPPVGPKWGEKALAVEAKKKDDAKWARDSPNGASNASASNDDKWAQRGQAVPDNSKTGKAADDGGWGRGKALPVELYKGGTSENGVVRYSAADLMAARLESLAPPLSWTETVGPPAHIRWTAEDRVQIIAAITSAARIGGDVSKMKGPKSSHDTAPRLEDCKPLEVNDETRWKAGVLGAEDVDEDAAILKRALIVLNKLTLTTFEKLSNEFIDSGITNNVSMLSTGIDTIVSKAQQETHFSEMYARLCLKLARTSLPNLGDDPAKPGKVFKKMLVTKIQQEFEKDTAKELAEKTEGMEQDEVKYWEVLSKKYYLGHIVFIGELYKTELIQFKVVMTLLQSLLGNDPALDTTDSEGMLTAASPVDDEKIECLLKLLTNVGYYLSEQAKALREAGKDKDNCFDRLNTCFRNLNGLAKGSAGMPAVNSRVKFMCKDLLEMKDKGWQLRREEEKAKTIDEIHRDIEREERRSGNRSSGSTPSSRSSAVRSGQGDARKVKQTAVDGDGWATVVPVKGQGQSRSSASSSARSPTSDSSSGPVKSSFGALAASKPSISATPTASPDEAGKAVVSSFREFLTGGDADELKRTVLESVGSSKEHGSAVFRDSVLALLEMKEAEATTFTPMLFSAPFTPSMIQEGFADPVEFWADIAIDAPLAKVIMRNFLLAAKAEGYVEEKHIEAMENGAETVKLMQ
jgi:translation initiation factor 4G